MKPKQRSQKVPESGVLRACLDLLAAEKIWNMRMNTGAMKVGTRFTRFGRPGTADILAAPIVTKWYTPEQHGGLDKLGVEGPIFLWIECKSSTGKQSAQQKEFEAEALASCHRYLLARKPEDLIEWLENAKRGIL
jgi:hypothetical protein